MKRLEVGDWVIHPHHNLGRIRSFSPQRTYLVVAYPFLDTVRVGSEKTKKWRWYLRTHATSSVRYSSDPHAVENMIA